MTNEILILDLETRTYGKPDADKDKIKLFGCYSYITNRPYILTDISEIQTLINKHKYIVGFNIKKYDNPILQRHGISLKYKYIIDLMDIFKRRAGQMMIKKGMLKDLLMSYSLDYITKTLDIVSDDTAKKKIDYTLFQKDKWTPEELKEIKEYLVRDIDVTKKLYEWTENHFSSLKSFLTEHDIKSKAYLTASPASIAYKAICKAMKWSEEYGQGWEEDDESISGGYVAYPAGERFEGNIYCLDFNSLYPHIMIMCNLYGRRENNVSDRPFWIGGDKWKVDGSYYSDELAEVGKLLKKWYADRVEFKKVKDPREYGIKIIINIIYGILNNPTYIRVYDKIAGGDCTRIGRQWTRYARKIFREAGYKIIYSDTDSIYIQDPYNDKEKMLKVKDEIINTIKQTVPFPQDTFDMGIDAEINYMFFFKGGGKENDDEMDDDDYVNKAKGFMKKNYIYVEQDGKVVIKNLGIRKKSNSPLSKKIFNDDLMPKIKEGQVKFSKTLITNLITKYLEEDIMLASLRKDVGTLEQYKKSPTGLQAQISKQYGPGIHFLIPNTKNIGVGKGKSYCTVEEFNERKLNWTHIDTTGIWKELDYFIKPLKVISIFDFDKKTGNIR